MLPPIGFSTGCFYATHDPIAVETLSMIADLGADAIELSPQNMAELEVVAGAAYPLSRFRHISLHPKKVAFGQDTIALTVELVNRIYDQTGAAVVVHPNEVCDFERLRGVRAPLLFENMDARSTTFIGPDEFQDLVPGMGQLVLDLNHCYTHDRSLKLARAFKESYAQHLAEVHLSGFAGFHEPLCQTGQTEILEALPMNIPVIIESGCTSLEIAARELALVRQFIVDLPHLSPLNKKMPPL